ncbi:twin-arginine translocase TatA/TatE family subunit [Denitrificimonas sp. JX-1]|uniref:Sec-independent protein translocase protein TatA n=1 Tax=Denitrificimonas halotolerans TaxID=3098930 RepID=A0ABU5GRH9_9GAMM|nr:twin-arginine translocase TatA/TatE family subunit [Denitrificimonas sp. JX-1]MDY7219295.1 twin-arginine translocase TatA/TatE family subunit [Denitrificimonas sp. JX-1]
MGGISVWQLLIILAIVVLLFGTKRLKGVGSDLGDAIKGFRKAVDTGEEKPTEAVQKKETTDAAGHTIDATAEHVEDSSSKK